MVGGAERTERRRKQQARQAVRPARTAASGPGNRSRVITAVAVVVVLAAAVIGGVLWQRSRSAPPDQPPPHQAAAAYPVRLDGGGVLAGADTAKAVVDIYEDFLCPACGAFEKDSATKIEDALNAGTIRVRYHILNMLDEQSNPAGYSLEAASAALCAAEAGAFPGYHASLFASQPREGGRGYTVDQLVRLGHDLGVTAGTFDTCVRGGTHKDAVRAQLDAALADPALRHPSPRGGEYFGTPTVVAAGKVIDQSRPTWLDDAIRAATAG